MDKEFSRTFFLSHFNITLKFFRMNDGEETKAEFLRLAGTNADGRLHMDA